MDVLQWLIDSAEGIEAQTDHLAARIQIVNFASIHTTLIVCLVQFRLTLDFHSCII